MVDKATKFESFGDDLEDETATATADEKGGGDGTGENSDTSKTEEGTKDESGKETDGADNKSGGGEDVSGSTDASSDGAASGKEGEGSGTEKKEEEGTAAAEAGGDGSTDEKSAEGTEATGTKDTDGDESGKEGEAAAGEGSDADEGKDEKAGAEGKETEKEGDFFAESTEDKGEGAGKEREVSYKPVAEKLGIKLENDTEEELIQKYNEKIEAAKQELKLDDYNEQSRSLIKHLNTDDGDIGQFLTNPLINEMQGVLNMEPEDKVRVVRINEMKGTGMKEDDAIEKYNTELQEMSVSDIRKMSDGIDKQAKELRDQEIVKITGDKETKLKEQRIAADNEILQERTKLKDHIQAQEDFLGIKLSATAKAQILTDLETGNFDNIVEKTPEASKFFAYMVNRYGSKIMESFSQSNSDANREGYNKATDKHTSALHKSKEDATGKAASGHQKGEEGTKKNFQSWEDKTIFGED